MFTFNKSEAEKLLEGLREDGIKVSMENIDSYISQSGVLVSIHVGRKRGAMELSGELLGLDMNNDAIKGFFESHVKTGQMHLVPVQKEKLLKKIEGRIRAMKDRYAIGYERSFMPKDIYKEFKKELDASKEEYFAIRDEIADDWDTLVSSFKVDLGRLLDKTMPNANKERKESLMKAIMSKVPTKEAYKESFYMRPSLRAFPVMEHINLLDDELEDEVRQTAIETNTTMVYEVIGQSLNEAFKALIKINTAYEKHRRVPPKSESVLKNASSQLRKRNLFRNAMIEEIAVILEKVDVRSEDLQEDIEAHLSKIYGYADEIGVSAFVDTKESPLDRESLLIIYSTL